MSWIEFVIAWSFDLAALRFVAAVCGFVQLNRSSIPGHGAVEV